MEIERNDAVVDLDHLAQYTSGDRALEAELFELFLTNGRAYLTAMSSAGDAAAWCEAAHALKGSARGIGAKIVAQISAEAEAVTEMPVSGERDRMLAALQGALTDVEAFAHASYPSFGQHGAGV